jgi:excisionase family DNA binding protein
MREQHMRRAYRLGEVSAMIGVPAETLRRWCDRGEIPHFRIGKTIFIAREHVEKTWQL